MIIYVGPRYTGTNQVACLYGMATCIPTDKLKTDSSDILGPKLDNFPHT